MQREGSDWNPRDAIALSEHLALALDAGGLGTWRWDLESNVVVWDAALEAMHGLAPGEFLGTFEAYVALLHPADADTVLETVREAVESKSPYKVEHRSIAPDGTVRWLQGRGKVMTDSDGRVTGTIGCVADVTEQVRTFMEREEAVRVSLEAAAEAQINAQRIEFLGRINDALAESNTARDVLRNITRVSVPHMGEWCALYVLRASKSDVPDMAIAHADSAMVAYAKQMQERFPYNPNAKRGVPEVIRTGRSEFLPRIDDAMIDASEAPDEARDVLRSLRLRSAITVPLLKRGVTIGALQFVNTESSRAYTDDDLALARAVAARVASTLENRRLAEQQRMIATTLQASLLPTALPRISGLDVAVRYWAGGEGTQVGGDFYDVFAVNDRWAAVIGDVCGTGPEAAALTGLARHSIRAAAWNGADPDDVLRQLNHAVRRSEQRTFCTALYSTLEANTTGFIFSAASGGHPLPIIARSSGGCETFGEPGSLLGVLTDSTSTTCSTPLEIGDVVVLYTDGATDAAPPYDLNIASMIHIVRTSVHNADSADDIAAAIGREIDAIQPLRHRNDDIALLILRVAERPTG